MATGANANGSGAHIAAHTRATTHDEVVHTTSNHPWLSADHGWLPASLLVLGEPIVRVDGGTAVVVAIRAVAGPAAMWDLTVSQVHTFAVGTGEYVVHNCGSSSGAYEDRVKQANGDTTVGESNSHRWDGSQPVTDAAGQPVDRDWAGPDAVRDYGGPNETWIEAKSHVSPGQDIFANNEVDRNFNQLARYERMGRPFEYWLDAEPSQLSRDVIEAAGGKVIIFQ